MTELEKLQRAKLYMDKLAEGVDPVTDTEMPDDCILNQVRLSRCFFYVSDVLRRVIENDGAEPENPHRAEKEGAAEKPAQRPAVADFELTPEQRKAFIFSDDAASVSNLVAALNALIDPEHMKKLTNIAVTDWLLEAGFLEKVESDGKSHRLPTEQGERIGLSTMSRRGQNGEYTMVLYNKEAQRFILDNLEAIMQNRRNKS
ncbi:MAG TPA: hypothetical protein PK629_06345 [Oscillospiraceae bacterium]|nr:hypothetical protein [Oscillospiraceae bacterium]HPF56343.1 hypothetical protein [Clostridiales bacterium]HPK35996.1 hypothetical protein [Oscillospiraceae bacterium]HPR76655.1 hypothetical protein [Oscillospiraceae bacterium]